MIDDALRRRLNFDDAQVMLTARISPPMIHRYISVPRRATARPTFKRTRSWDHFVVLGDEIRLATIRQNGKDVFFEGMSSGPLVGGLLTAIEEASNSLSSCREPLYLRVLECRPARLMAIVAQARSGASFYVKVIDKTPVARPAMTVSENVDQWLRLVADRLAALPQESLLSLWPR
ncbi:MAG: hypothetical protein WBW32_03840 [Luteibacter sp.]